MTDTSYVFACRFIAFAVCHSVLATPAVQHRFKTLFGRWWRYYRLGYNLISIIMFGWVMAAYGGSRIIWLVPGVWGPLCHLAQGVLFLILIRCAAQAGIGDFLGFNQIKGRTPGHALIKDSCYARVRHPQYSLAVVFLLLNPVVSINGIMLTLLSAAYFIFGAVVEEKRLVSKFAEEYRRYRESVPMFVPDFHRRRPGVKEEKR